MLQFLLVQKSIDRQTKVELKTHELTLAQIAQLARKETVYKKLQS